MKRAQLSPFWQSQKKLLEKTFLTLAETSRDDWYPSLWAETRSKSTYLINAQAEQISEDETSGVVLRIYDGQTLFEKAVSEISEEQLLAAAVELVERVKDLGSANIQRTYSGSSWVERRAQNLDPEILQQIPESADEKTWVHFGCAQKENLWASQSETMTWAKSLFQKLSAVESQLEPDYQAVNLALVSEDQVFMDPHVWMTQAMRRNRVMMVSTKGGDRGYNILGGVGGIETVDVSDADIAMVSKRLEDCVNADRLEPGAYTVLLSPAVAGVFAHEAFGHTQEGDTWAKGRSKARELYENNTRVGNDHATIMNNPAVYKNADSDYAAWGSYYFDEEGWFASPQILVEKGYLKPPMTHLTSSLRLNVPRTANGKRQDWSRGMYTRQTNTYFTPGDKTLDELIAQVDYGFLAEECAGGMEDPKGMGIQVGIAYLEEIKDGKLTGKTFKGPNGGAVQMTGYVPDCLNHILDKSMIDPAGKEQNLEHPRNDVGGCGKYHKEFVNAGCGGPYMLVEKTQLG